MRRYFFIIAVIFSFLLTNCKEDSDENTLSTDSIKVNLSDTTVVDTSGIVTDVDERVIVDTQVVFFLPSPRERMQMIKFYGTYDQYDFQAVFNNFLNLSQVVRSALRARGIAVEITYAKRFVFPMQDDTLVYDLEKEDQMMGYILADGINMPMIKNGVQKRKQVSNDIRNYFNLKNFNLGQ